MVQFDQPLQFRNLAIKNRVIRAGYSPTHDDRPERVILASFDWELRFAEAGAGAIISPRAVVRPVGLATEIPAVHPCWQEHVGRVHAHRCPYIIRIGQGNSVHAAPTAAELRDLVLGFAEAARAVRDAGADGVEIDGARGSLIARFMGPGLNDRPDGYQGSQESRGRLAREIVQAVRRSVGRAFHVQVRLGASSPLGMMAAGTLELVRWLEEDGIDAVHLTPDGDHPGAQAEGPVGFAARYVKDVVSIPVLRNGLFLTEDSIRTALGNASCGAVTLTRPLVRRPAAWDLGTKKAA
jgi:2,4-dienoyl-CoA reductase-like NADH-dependent reductase (Old Yellow Enzyme family)